MCETVKEENNRSYEKNDKNTYRKRKVCCNPATQIVGVREEQGEYTSVES